VGSKLSQATGRRCGTTGRLSGLVIGQNGGPRSVTATGGEAGSSLNPGRLIYLCQERYRAVPGEIWATYSRQIRAVSHCLDLRAQVRETSEEGQPCHTGVVDEPVTRYAMSGDLHIAYQAFGDGPFDLVYAPGFISHVEMNWELAYWRNIFLRLARFCRVIVFDKRGTGLSDRVAGWPTFEERMDDIRAVMDAAGIERAALLGVSEGGPMCMLFAALYPERTQALVLRGTGPRMMVGPDWPWGWSRELVTPMIEAAEQNWGTGTVLSYFVQGLADDPRGQELTGRFERFAASPGAARQLLEMNFEVDVRQVLPAISAPTLVVHRTGDYVIPVEAGRYSAQLIPNASLVELPGDFHLKTFV